MAGVTMGAASRDCRASLRASPAHWLHEDVVHRRVAMRHGCCAIEASWPAAGSAAPRMVAHVRREMLMSLALAGRPFATPLRRWLLVAGRPMCADGGARWGTIAPRLSRAKFMVAAAAGRPPLRRVSGDVVTAGLISSRVWFGPVPGSP
ncbi:hypothetical protein F511_27321 [Dorcoceras hygrometricum]|uniref:Uncharacterized protein n=1 Tax=Dorcoceras hygrometricum TaxID=472368 RepID=A0A2Z7B8F1_9LAMI|nr:hypothetical protein F511_27321 [Dorcoceras hygrometricum]